MAGFTRNWQLGGWYQFHIGTPNLAAKIRQAAANKKVIDLQLDGDELDAALWGLENYKKAGK